MKKENKDVKNKKNLKAIFVLIMFILIAIVAVIIVFNLNINKEKVHNETTKESYVEESEEEIKINKNEQLLKKRDVNGFVISNIQLTTQGGNTTFLADITNNSGAKSTPKIVRITLLDENQKELVAARGMIDELDVGQTTQINISLASDYINAYDFKVEIQ